MNLCNRPFEVDVIFPERVIGIDEQSLSAIFPTHLFMITAPGRIRGFDKLVFVC
jgi:hypothetical protein